MRSLPPLTRKLLRDLWRLRGQGLAIALVMAAGVGMAVMSYGMMRSLEATRSAYYEGYGLAQVWVPLRRAPDSLARDIAAVDGVATVETRISGAATVDLPGIAEPVQAQLHSLPVTLNRLVLRSGRIPRVDAPNEVLANEAFVQAARLPLGSRVPILVYAKRIELILVGTAISPEHIYAVAPGQIFPDNRRFGIIWMAREPLSAALDMRDGFNEVLLRLAPGAKEAEVIRRVDRISAAYGPSGAFGRSLSISDRFLSSEIEQLETTVRILPPIFLAVSAFLLNILLARLIDTEREIIGLLKAFGYRNRTIAWHYAQLAVLLSGGGVLLGWLLGGWLGRGIAGIYQDYFAFPFLAFSAGADSYLASGGLALAAVLTGAFTAVWRAQRLPPADAMRPPAPSRYSNNRLTNWLVQRLPDEPSYVASASSTDNFERMIQLVFERGQRADLALAFAEARDPRIARELTSLPGVQRAEGYRAVAVELVQGARREREAILGLPPGAALMRIVALDGSVQALPPNGALISSQLARKLNLAAGDLVEVQVTEGRRPRFRLPIARVVDVPLGAAVVIDRRQLNRLMQEGDLVSGAYLMIDPARTGELYRALKATPQVVSVTVAANAVRGIRETVAESMGIVTLFNTLFAMLCWASRSSWRSPPCPWGCCWVSPCHAISLPAFHLTCS
ncbi:MAG: ABC transporter permease [Novosphingobium sp.]|nr:ABC transporter permease [Novosphingobium sp.]